MKLRTGTILVIAIFCLVPTAALCDLAPYSQDLEGLDQADPSALANDGWMVFANVFGPDWSYWYGYGPYPAPNGGPGFCGIDLGQGDPEQGDQQLIVYNDYNNANHGDGSNAIIEANVFQEQIIGAADVGKTWRFEFDAKLGNLEGASMAAAFFKTLDPNAGYALTNLITVDMTTIPDTWDSYSTSIFIDASLEGQILQFGFMNWASNYEGSGIFYDNINFNRSPISVSLDIRPSNCPNPVSNNRGLLPGALLGAEDFDVYEIDVASLRLEGVPAIQPAYEDVAGPFAGDPCGCAVTRPDCFLDLTINFVTQQVVDAIGSAYGVHELKLTGALLDGTPIEGRDCVVFVGGGGGKKDVRAEVSEDSNILELQQSPTSITLR